MPEIQVQQPNTQNDEISLKELILKIKEWVNYLKTKWVIILSFGIIGAGIGYVYAYLQKPKYTAILTFALEEEKSVGGGLPGAIGLANSLGIDFGGGSGGGAFSGANLMELMKSRTLVEKALLNPITINGQIKSLADYFIDISRLNKGWDKKKEFKNIQFKPLGDRTKYTSQQDSILGILYRNIIGEGILFVSQKDKKISIITIEVKSADELFSKNFAENVARVVSDFYIDTKTKKAKLNYDILRKQTDSVRAELNAAISGVAVANDNTYNLNPALNIKRIPSARRQVDVQANTAIFTQLVANLEMSKVSLRKETPLIQIIDSPILPLGKTQISKIQSFILYGFFGSVITILVLTLRRVWRKIMYS